MMPLPFVKVAAKAFKRNLLDDGDESDSTTDSSSISSSSSSSSTISSNRSKDTATTTTTTKTTTTSGGSGDGDESRPRSSVALKNLKGLNYTVPSLQREDDAEGDRSSPSQSRSTSPSHSTTTTTLSTSTTSGSATLNSESTNSGSTTSSTTSATGSATDSSSKTKKGGGGGSGGGGATTSSSDFSLDFSLDPDDVIDPRTGRHVFARTAREVKTTTLPEKEPTPPPTLSLDPSGLKSPVAARVNHAVSVGMHSARSSIRSSKTAQSASRGLKKTKKTALLTLRIGEYVVKTQIIRPVAKKAVQEWKTFNRFRDRKQTQRRSKTLDWFEDRVENAKRKESIERKRQQDLRRAKWRKHLKHERSRRQLNDFLSETRKELVHRADLRLATSLEKEKVRDYFLDNNDSWQMQTLTRHAQEDEERERKRKEDAEADKVRDGDVKRQAAADEYLAEYDRAEVVTQAMLRIMRRSGIIAGVNAPLKSIEDTPLETDTYLLLRPKGLQSRVDVAQTKTETGTGSNSNGDCSVAGRLPSPPGVGHTRQSSDGRSKAPSSSPAGGGSQQHRRVDRLKIPAADATASSLREAPRETETIGRQRGSGAASLGSAAAPDESRAGEPSRGGGISRRAGGHGRGKKKSSGVFEVDLLRFRGVEEIRGWKLGVPGGEGLGKDFASGACPRLRVLRLGWCSLGDRGARAIVRALCGGGGSSGAGRTLQELDLRGNAVTVVGLRVLGSALAFGGLPALRALDLGSNSLRDEGGKAVAHRLLAGAGTWRQLVRLDLSGNGMGDGGVEAVFKAATAPGVALAPDLEMISVRGNSVTSGARQRISCPPSFLVM